MIYDIGHLFKTIGSVQDFLAYAEAHEATPSTIWDRFEDWQEVYGHQVEDQGSEEAT